MSIVVSKNAQKARRVLATNVYVNVFLIISIENK